MATAAIEFREGDVYRFSYSEAARERWRTDPYWCFDGQVVVRNGQLCDTYWSFGACGDARVVRPEDGTLTFVCNLNDVREVKEYECKHYAESDCFNLSSQHGCYKRFAVRKDAPRSPERMLEEIRKKEQAIRDEMERVVRGGGHDLMRLGEMRAKLECGDTSIHIWW